MSDIKTCTNQKKAHKFCASAKVYKFGMSSKRQNI